MSDICAFCLQAKVVPGSITVSPRGDLFAVTSSDKQIRVFDFCSGKLRRGYNESSAVYAHTSVASSTASHLSEHDLGRRLATEREIESDTDALARCNAVFDDSGNFLVSRLVYSIYFLCTGHECDRVLVVFHCNILFVLRCIVH